MEYTIRNACAADLDALEEMEALCFCGSGKPFKECHGKRK